MEDYLVDNYIQFIKAGNYDKINSDALIKIAEEYTKLKRASSDSNMVFNALCLLIGPINPIGDSREDEIRFNNLETFVEVFDKMYCVMDDIVYYNKGKHEASIKRAVDCCNQFLTKFTSNLTE